MGLTRMSRTYGSAWCSTGLKMIRRVSGWCCKPLVKIAWWGFVAFTQLAGLVSSQPLPRIVYVVGLIGAALFMTEAFGDWKESR